MLLVTQELNVPPVNTTILERSIYPFNNRSILIADWIAYKRIIWGRLSPRPPSDNDSKKSKSRRSISNYSPSCHLMSRSVYPPVVNSVREWKTKTDDVINVLRKSLLWKSIANNFSIEEI